MKSFMKKSIASILMLTIFLSLFTGITGVTAQAATTKIKVTVKHPDMNTIRLNWSSVEGAYGYHVYYKDSASDSYKKVASTLENKIVFDGLKSDKFYYFKIKAYKVTDGEEVTVATSDEIKARSNKIGIDVSKWQGTIDWEKVKAAGIEYAIIRVAYGTSKTAETRYIENIEGAKAAGIPVGVYIYSTATTVSQAKKEADYVLELIDGYDLEYPVAFDIEDSVHSSQGKTASGRKTNTNLTIAFCEKIKAAGYTPMVYTGCYFARSYINIDDLSDYDLWIAHYKSTSEYAHYTGSYHFGSSCDFDQTRFWQYSSLGTVNGISGKVDMNYELDLGTSVYGMPHYNVSTGQETYVAASSDTLSSIAKKYNVTVSELVASDKNYDTSSTIKKGTAIVIKSTSLAKIGISVDKVSNVKAVSSSYNSVKITWSDVTYNDGYEVYRSTSKTGTYTKVATVTSTSYQDKKLKNNQTYYYRVYAFKQNGDAKVISTSASTVSATPVQANITNLKVSSTTYNSVTLSWKKSSGATKYKIYYSTSKNGTYKTAGYSTTTSFTHTKRKTGTKYYYKVLAIRNVNDKNYYSEKSSAVKGTPSLTKPKVTKTSAKTTSVTLKWSKVAGAKKYVVYRATSKNGTYKKVAVTSSTTYTNKNLSRNKKYYYKIRAYRVVNGKNVYSSYSSIKAVKTK